ncbi:unnamed protein product, partial [Laminaria digitata]
MAVAATAAAVASAAVASNRIPYVCLSFLVSCGTFYPASRSLCLVSHVIQLPPWSTSGDAGGSREIGLLPIFLFSDVLACGGGTALLRGSHKKVADFLWERAGTTGMTGKAVFFQFQLCPDTKYGGVSIV